MSYSPLSYKWDKKGFLGQFVGDVLDEMTKNCMKITKSTFWGKTVGDEPVGETLQIVYVKHG